jgi:hypothetical protein
MTKSKNEEHRNEVLSQTYWFNDFRLYQGHVQQVRQTDRQQ